MYEIKDWLGAPRLTYSDIKRPFDPTLPKFLFSYKLDYLSATTIYPFGAEIESLSFEKSQYRFGYTGHLKDNLIRPYYGDGANYSTLFREYDPIIGRWWSIDPLRAKYAGMSPYNYTKCDPINLLDPNGSKIKAVVNVISEALSAHMTMNHYKDFQKTQLYQDVDNDIKEYTVYLLDNESHIDDIRQLNLYPKQPKEERRSSRHNGSKGFMVFNINQITEETPWPVHLPHEFGHARRYQLGVKLPTANEDAPSPLYDNGNGVEMEEVFTVFFYENPWRYMNGLPPRTTCGGNQIFPSDPAMQRMLIEKTLELGRDLLRTTRETGGKGESVPTLPEGPLPEAVPTPPLESGDSLPHS